MKSMNRTKRLAILSLTVAAVAGAVFVPGRTALAGPASYGDLRFTYMACGNVILAEGRESWRRDDKFVTWALREGELTPEAIDRAVRTAIGSGYGLSVTDVKVGRKLRFEPVGYEGGATLLATYDSRPEVDPATHLARTLEYSVWLLAYPPAAEENEPYVPLAIEPNWKGICRRNGDGTFVLTSVVPYYVPTSVVGYQALIQ